MLALLAMAGAALSACSPTAEPSPTPTAAFASEEEAFAAAEETYRAYNDAVNQKRDGDENADPQSFLTGLALENDIEAIQLLKSEGVHVAGHGELIAFNPEQANVHSMSAKVIATICLDVEATRVLNDRNEDVTPQNRPLVVGLEVEFVGTQDGLMISDSNENPVDQC